MEQYNQHYINELLKICNPSEDQYITAFELYVEDNKEKLRNRRFSINGRHLTLEEVVEEMKQKTNFGLQYLEALKESIKERKAGQN